MVQAKTNDRQGQQGDGQHRLLPIGRRDQEHHRQLRPAAQHGMDFVAPDRAFPGFGEAPARLGIVVIPGVLGGGIQNDIRAVNHSQADQLADQGDEEKPKRQDAQGPASFPILADADHPTRGQSQPAGPPPGGLRK